MVYETLREQYANDEGAWNRLATTNGKLYVDIFDPQDVRVIDDAPEETVITLA